MKRYIRASLTSGLVGLWWYTDDGEVWALTKTLDDAELDGIYYQYSLEDNHLTEWESTVHSHIDNRKLADAIIKKGYRSFERGRVIYDTRTQVYELTCSDAIGADIDALNKIKDAFELNNCRVKITPIPSHYDKYVAGTDPLRERFELFGWD